MDAGSREDAELLFDQPRQHDGGEVDALDGEAVALEHLVAIKRAGADIILTYFARDLALALQS